MFNKVKSCCMFKANSVNQDSSQWETNIMAPIKMPFAFVLIALFVHI